MLRPHVVRPLTELDELVFELVIPPDHFLRQVLSLVDFVRFWDWMAPCYSPDMGRPAEDPVLMLKLEFLQFHDNLSDRKVIERAKTDVAYRHFLGVPLAAALPDPSSLTYFRGRLGVDKHQQIFDELIVQAREHGLVRDRLRLKDATHVIANIAIPSTIRLVAQARDRLLLAAEPFDTVRVTGERARVEMIRASGQGLSREEQLVARVEHLQEIVAWIDQLDPSGDSSIAERTALCDARNFAHKILQDRARDKTPDRTVSVHDSDARWGHHGEIYCGYKLDISMDADSRLITALNVMPANGDEVDDATTLIHHEEEIHGNDVAAMSIDSVGFDGAKLAEWTDAEGLNLEVFVPPKKQIETKYFKGEEFHEDESGQALVCPAGEKSFSRNRNEDKTGWIYRFDRRTCIACPLAAQCVKSLKWKGRSVNRTDHAAHRAAAREKAKTEKYRHVRKEHLAVERKIWELVQQHQGRRARCRGLPKVTIQQLLTGFCVNVQRIVRMLANPT